MKTKYNFCLMDSNDSNFCPFCSCASYKKDRGRNCFFHTWDERFGQDCCSKYNGTHQCECCCDCSCPTPHPQPPKPKPDPDPVVCSKSALQVILKETEAQIIDIGDNILFDTVLVQIGDDIVYDPETGEITLKKAGNYKISWQVILGGSDTTRFVNFGIKLNGESYHDFPLPVTAGLLTSDLLLTTENADAVITLFNNTGDKVRLSRHLPNANLVIISI